MTHKKERMLTGKEDDKVVVKEFVRSNAENALKTRPKGEFLFCFLLSAPPISVSNFFRAQIVLYIDCAIGVRSAGAFRRRAMTISNGS